MVALYQFVPMEADGYQNKRKVMQRVIDRYGTYLHHLTALTQSKAQTGSVSRAKMIIGSAVMLKPAAALKLDSAR